MAVGGLICQRAAQPFRHRSAPSQDERRAAEDPEAAELTRRRELRRVFSFLDWAWTEMSTEGGLAFDGYNVHSSFFKDRTRAAVLSSLKHTL